MSRASDGLVRAFGQQHAVGPALLGQFQVARDDEPGLPCRHFAQTQRDRIQAEIVRAGVADAQLHDVDAARDGGFHQGQGIGLFVGGGR